MQVQVHTDDNIQGGESLAQWVQQEATARLARFRDILTRLEVFMTDTAAGKESPKDKRCRLEARPAGRQPVTVTCEADKTADAFAGAVDKLIRVLETDLGRVKDRNARETIRTQDEPDEA